MGVFDKIKGAFGVDDDEELEDNYEEETEEETPVENTFKADFTQSSQPSFSTTAVKREKPVSATTGTRAQYVLVKPSSFSEAVIIADNINAKKTVVINLEECESQHARRLVDFLSGVSYANDAKLLKIANATFICTPSESDFSGFGIDESEGNY